MSPKIVSIKLCWGVVGVVKTNLMRFFVLIFMSGTVRFLGALSRTKYISFCSSFSAFNEQLTAVKKLQTLLLSTEPSSIKKAICLNRLTTRFSLM